MNISTPPRAARRATILVVDDEAPLRQLIRINLEADGYGVRTAPDARAALEEIGAGGIDLVITDIRMPGLDGWALCRALREDARSAALPIVALTIAPTDAPTEGVRDELVEAVLAKPFDPAHLRTTLERILGMKSGEEGAR